MLWKNINENFMDWLRANYESRIPQTNYGPGRFKPFFGSLFEVGDLLYVTQISSPKERHAKMKQSLDFYKIYHPTDDKLIAVVNLNFMFPVHKSLLGNLRYSEIDKLRSFNNAKERSKYIAFLRMELQEINKLNLEDAAQRIYNLKEQKPDHAVSRRSFDFKALERACYEYIKA